MPPWLTAFLVLILMSGLGAYMVYGIEGFYDTANTTCKKNFQACQNACGSSNKACFSGCSEPYEICLAKAANAASVAVTGNLQGRYMDSILKYVQSNNPDMLGSNDAASSAKSWWPLLQTGNVAYSTDKKALDILYGSNASPGSDSDYSSIYNSMSNAKSNSASSSSSSSSSNITYIYGSSSSSSSNSKTTNHSAWDKNRDTYHSGWPSQKYNSLHTDGAYDSDIGLEGSYNVQIKKWKPHEIPTPEVVRNVSAPTDEGTVASQIRHDSYPTPSLQQLIREDAKDTVDGIFRNQYEIKYS